MSRALDRMHSRRYLDSVEVLGDMNVGDFVPWLNMVGKVAGAAGGQKQGGQDDVMKKMMEEQKRREEEQARRNKTLLLVFGGLAGAALLGTTVYLVAKK